jgi:hypothetical protein
VIADSDAQDGGIYGNDEQAEIVAQHSAAQASQGVYREARPDLLQKTVQVENADEKSNGKEREEWSGVRTKEFKISGNIRIDESVTGGTCKASNGCEASSGKKSVESLTRVADGAAYVDESCAKSSAASNLECCACATN